MCDNCPTTANADQADGDGDGVGDACAPAIPPDAHEPNNDPASATDLGQIGEEGFLRIGNANFHDPATDKDDYYRVDVVEEADIICGFPPEDETFNVVVQLFPPAGSDYDLEVTILGATFSSTNAGSATETLSINFAGICGVDDSAEVLIRVQHFAGPATATAYTLDISFLDIST